MEKKEHVIDIRKDFGTRYNSNSVVTCWCGKPIKGVRQQVSKFNSCKDYLHDDLRHQTLSRVLGRKHASSYTSGGGYSYEKDGPYAMDYKKTRLLFARSLDEVAKSTETGGQINEGFSKGFKAGKRIINMFEKELGWTKSVIFKAKCPPYGVCYGIVGPPQWMAVPHFLSFYVLVLRFFAEDGRTDQFKSPEEFDKFMEALHKRKVPYTFRDGGYLGSVAGRAVKLLLNYKKLLEGFTEEDWFPMSDWSAFHSSGGMVSLCTDNRNINAGIRERVKKILSS